MSQSHLPDNGPDWAVIGGILAAMATIATALAAGMKGMFRRNGNSLQVAREKAATENAALTLDSVFRLVNELQEEAKRLREALSAAEAHYSARILECETKVDRLLVRIGELEQALRNQSGGMT